MIVNTLEMQKYNWAHNDAGEKYIANIVRNRLNMGNSLIEMATGNDSRFDFSIDGLTYYEIKCSSRTDEWTIELADQYGGPSGLTVTEANYYIFLGLHKCTTPSPANAVYSAYEYIQGRLNMVTVEFLKHCIKHKRALSCMYEHTEYDTTSWALNPSRLPTFTTLGSVQPIVTKTGPYHRAYEYDLSTFTPNTNFDLHKVMGMKKVPLLMSL